MNNTRLFQRQALFVVLVVIAGCGASKKPGTPAGKAPPPALPAGSSRATADVAPAPLPLPGMVPSLPKAGPSAGGVLHVQLETDPPHLNPLEAKDQVIGQVTDGLVYEHLIECRQDRYLPVLAESWAISPDGRRLLLHLRDGVRWQDGRLFGAVDVQATLETLLAARGPMPVLRAMLADVEAVDVVPGRIVRFRLARPSSFVLRALCEIPILPETLLRGRGTGKAALAKQPMGTGPFRLATWERGKRIRLVHNADWWGGGGGPGEISFEIETDGARALVRARRGEIDIVPHVLDVHYPEQVTRAALQDRFLLHMLSPDRYSFVVINHRNDLLALAPVRRALALLWDRRGFAENLRHGLVRPIGAPTFGDVADPGFDRTAAARLLDEAGLQDSNGDGVRDRRGSAIKFKWLQPLGSRAATEEAHGYAAQLRRVGLLVEIVPVDPGNFEARLHDGDFDLAPMVWEGREDENPCLIFGAGGALAFTGYRSAGLASLCEKLRTLATPAERRPVLREAAHLLAAETPVIFLYRYDVPVLSSTRVHGLAALGGVLDFRSVWVAP